MSRVGKMPIAIPEKVKVTINRNEVTVKGPKGELSRSFNPDITVREDEGQIWVERPSDLKHHRSLHGLTRALINNMVVGVSSGFERILDIEGVGYRAEMQGKTLVLHLGYSHPINVEPTDTLEFEVPKDKRGTQIIVRGIKKEEVGQVAAEIRGHRPPEPYLGKGVRYQGEYIRRKAGKSGKK